MKDYSRSSETRGLHYGGCTICFIYSSLFQLGDHGHILCKTSLCLHRSLIIMTEVLGGIILVVWSTTKTTW